VAVARQVEDVATDLFEQRPLGHAEELGDLEPGEHRLAGAQEELRRFTVEHDVADRRSREPPSCAQVAHDPVQLLAA